MNKLLTSLLLAGAVVAGGALAPAEAADVGAKFPRVSIKNLSFNGSGCPRNDTLGDIVDTDDDGLPDTFFVLFGEAYTAAVGPGISITEGRKNCNIILVLDLPQGLQFSIASVRYDGFASLERGVSGQQRSDYQFPLFGSRTATAQTILRGPLQELYDRTDVLGIASIVWSPCGIDAPLNIRTQVKVYGPPHRSGTMELDQTLGRVQQVYGFTWRRCQSRPRSG